LSEKYQSLVPQKSGIVVPANTPATSRASSMSGGAEAEEAVGKATEVSKSTEPPPVSTSTSPFPKSASLRQHPTVQKRADKPKRRGNNGRDSGSVVDGRESMLFQRLMDHDSLSRNLV
jgi:hypothetical protein